MLSTRIHTIRWGTALLLLAAMAAIPARGEDGEFYVNTYRSMGDVSPRGSRSVAMGRAGRGLADGVASLGVNPAALGAFSGTEVDVALGYDWLDDGYDDTGQFTFKLGGAVNLDRWQSTAYPNQAIGGLIHTRNFSGAGGNDMKREQTSLLMGYGLHLMDDVLAGVSVALFDGKMRSSPFTTTIVDDEGNPVTTTSLYQDRSFIGGDFRAGGIYRLSEETTVGGTLGYTTGSLKEKAAYARGAGTGSLRRYSLGLGVAHQYREETLLLGDIWLDRTKSRVPGTIRESNTGWGISAGVEQVILPEIMALRGGFYYDHARYSGGAGDTRFISGRSFSKGRLGITAGFGIKLYSYDVGFSLDVNANGDVKNVLDFSAEW